MVVQGIVFEGWKPACWEEIPRNNRMSNVAKFVGYLDEEKDRRRLSVMNWIGWENFLSSGVALV